MCLYLTSYECEALRTLALVLLLASDTMTHESQQREIELQRYLNLRCACLHNNNLLTRTLPTSFLLAMTTLSDLYFKNHFR